MPRQSSNQSEHVLRWCIYIDILGFSELWESDSGRTKALIALNRLMGAIIRIGRQVYPGDYSRPVERLFVHQIGDGFAIVSDSYEESLERPISIATALMRHVVASTGFFTSAAIAEGDLADIQGCYPEEARRSDNGTIILGSGIMTMFSVMGTAFIRAHKLASKMKPSWPFLVLSERDRGRVPPNISAKVAPNNALLINWIETQTPLLPRIQAGGGLQNILPDKMVQNIKDYSRLYPDIVRKWQEPLERFMDLGYDSRNLDS